MADEQVLLGSLTVLIEATLKSCQKIRSLDEKSSSEIQKLNDKLTRLGHDLTLINQGLNNFNDKLDLLLKHIEDGGTEAKSSFLKYILS